MRRGMFTLDAIVAVSLILLLFVLLQGQVSLDLSASNEFGVNSQLKARAIEAGSRMNSLYAIDPATGDWCSLEPKFVKAFPNLQVRENISKAAVQIKVTTAATLANVSGSSNYPVVSGLAYDAATQRAVK
jgi:hypothetical protein